MTSVPRLYSRRFLLRWRRLCHVLDKKCVRAGVTSSIEQSLNDCDWWQSQGLFPRRVQPLYLVMRGRSRGSLGLKGGNCLGTANANSPLVVRRASRFLRDRTRHAALFLLSRYFYTSRYLQRTHANYESSCVGCNILISNRELYENDNDHWRKLWSRDIVQSILRNNIRISFLHLHLW